MNGMMFKKKVIMENKHNSNGMGGGFLLGLLIGVLITLLFTTKKGREILRDLIDKVINKISAIDDIPEELEYAGAFDAENDYVKQQADEHLKKENPVSQNNGHSQSAKREDNKPDNKNDKSHRRLFLHRLQRKK